MSDQKKVIIEKVIVGIMLVVLGLSFLYSKIRSEKRSKIAQPQAGTFNLDSAKKLLKDVQKKGTIVDEDEEGVADPTKKPDELTAKKTPVASQTTSSSASSTTQQQKLTLEGIIWGGNKNMAMISGNVVYEGDTVAGAKVEKIEKGEVVLTKDNETIKLTR